MKMETRKFNEEDFNSFSEEEITEDESNENSKRTKTNKGKKKTKKTKNELYKPPTNEELNQLRETENLFNSNLFRLQIEEMLTELSIKQKRIAQFEAWYKSFEGVMHKLSEFDDVLVSQLKKQVKPTKQNRFINALIQNSFDYVNTDQDLTLKFIKPESCFAFGCYKTQTAVGSFMDFNVNITMPKTCFNVKDYLNNRYLVRRYYYLLYVAIQLNKSDICKDISVCFDKGNELLPVLLVNSTICDKIQIRIFFTPPAEFFKLSRFDLHKNNIKANVFATVDNIEQFKEATTSFYNATLAHDATLNENNNSIEQHIKDLKNVQDGIKLLFVWLTQRNLNKGTGCFENNLVLYVILYLINQKKINKFMSSYQVIRIFWNFLSSSDWSQQPISICEDVKQDDLMGFKDYYSTTLLDGTGHYNVAAFLNLDVYLRVRSEAASALSYLDNNSFNSFGALFITKLPFSIQYDAILCLYDDDNFKVVSDVCSPGEQFKYVGFYKRMIIQKITDVLKQGLNKRALHIVPDVQEENVWKLGAKRETSFNKLRFGIYLNQEYAFNPVEMGPGQYDHNAQEFRQFWGDLCHLRRFLDNKICEAVYFKSETMQEKRRIFKQMIEFMMNDKLNVRYSLVADEFERALSIENLVPPFKVGTNEEASLKVKAAFDTLREKLRAIKIQLGITAIDGASEFFSYTAPFPPIPTNYKSGQKITTITRNNILMRTDIKLGIAPRYVAPIECVFQLARDSKWPNDLKALRSIIAEFYFEISALLQQEYGIISNVHHNHMDVLHEGFIFRLRLYQAKEVMLLKKHINEEGLTSYKDTPESVELNTKLKILPNITGALNGLMLQHSSFGPSTALIKRWLRSQLIDDFHFPDIAIDLLNASLFLQSAPYGKSNLPQIAFLRFLKYFSELDFNLQLVLVNFNEKLTNEEINEIEQEFQQKRENFAPLFLLTPYDCAESTFTKANPTAAILRRVSVLARETYKHTSTSIMDSQLLHVKELFLPNFQGYNVLIHLNLLLVPRRYQSIQAENPSPIEIELYESGKCKKIPVVDFNPVQTYLKELRASYGEFALFFYDTYGGDVIAVLWKKDIFQEKDFKIKQVTCQKLLNNKLTFNTDAAVDDFHILGNGLVKNIEKI